MKTNHFIKVFIFVIAVLALPLISRAQEARKSPHDTITAVVAGANLRMVYGSPAVKGRTIWGDLVPYDKAWRGGADEATLFTTDKDITIQGKKLAAGTYSVFTVPGKDEWTYIFNSQTGQWGTNKQENANFDEAKNILTVTAKPHAVEMTEHLKYVFNKKGFALRWEKLEAPVTIK